MEDFKLHGQMNFDSGWEWGYWLSDVVTARAAWNPIIYPSSTANFTVHAEKEEVLAQGEGTFGDMESCVEALRSSGSTQQSSSPPAKADMVETFALIKRNKSKACTEKSYPTPHNTQWTAFSGGLAAGHTSLPTDLGLRLQNLLVRLTRVQYRLLVLGELQEGVPSPNLKKLSGIAYMSGGDTWIDLPHMLGQHTLQPTKIHLRETSDPHWNDVHPLLMAMEVAFRDIAEEMTALVEEATHRVEAEVGYSSIADANQDDSASTMNMDTSRKQQGNERLRSFTVKDEFTDAADFVHNNKDDELDGASTMSGEDNSSSKIGEDSSSTSRTSNNSMRYGADRRRIAILTTADPSLVRAFRAR